MNTRNSDVRKIAPAVNIIENNEEVVLEAEMVGLNKDEVTVDVKGDTLMINGKKDKGGVPEGYDLVYGERCGYEYERSFILGNEVDKGKIQAKYEEGILKITLPKSRDSQPKKIEIQ